MAEHAVMTAQELAHTREWLGNRSVYHPEPYTLIINRLLATVDALTQRAEQAEAERDDLARKNNYYMSAVKVSEDYRTLASLLGGFNEKPYGPDNIRAYIERLQAERERLEAENKRLREAIGKIADWVDQGTGHVVSHYPNSRKFLRELRENFLSSTQHETQALREREERVGALEKVYQVLSARWALRWHEATTEQDHAEVAALSAVAALDAERGQS